MSTCRGCRSDGFQDQRSLVVEGNGCRPQVPGLKFFARLWSASAQPDWAERTKISVDLEQAAKEEINAARMAEQSPVVRTQFTQGIVQLCAVGVGYPAASGYFQHVSALVAKQCGQGTAQVRSLCHHYALGKKRTLFEPAKLFAEICDWADDRHRWRRQLGLLNQLSDGC
jgi:hypothetical protein